MVLLWISLVSSVIAELWAVHLYEVRKKGMDNKAKVTAQLQLLLTVTYTIFGCQRHVEIFESTLIYISILFLVIVICAQLVYLSNVAEDRIMSWVVIWGEFLIDLSLFLNSSLCDSKGTLGVFKINPSVLLFWFPATQSRARHAV